MIRRFDLGREGRLYELCEGWRMMPDTEGVATAEHWEAGLPAAARPVAVPSCWNFELDLFSFLGDVWYETDFMAREDNIRLVFGAVNNECRVFVDGVEVVTHYGAFMEFGVTLPALGRGMHRLTLCINAHHNFRDTIPLERTDWFNYGGIIRPVEVHAFERAAILRFRIRYTLDVTARTADAVCECDLAAFTPVSDTLTVSLCGQTATLPVTLTGEDTVTVPLGTLSDLDLWDIDHGALYTAEVTFAGDTLRDRIGFREFRTEGKTLLLNGRPVEMRGVNRHEEHPAEGFAMSPALIKRDLDIIRRLGCNTVRGSHYPNNKVTLDLLDEMGLMFWEEIPMWGFKTAHLTNETVMARAARMHTEMITRDFNRPSIVIWGLENEAETITEDAKPIMKLMRDTVRSLDTSRPITYTSNRPNLECCYEYADIISVNLYPAWYGSLYPDLAGGYDSWPDMVTRITARMEEYGAGDKPLMLTEFGGAAVAGCVDPFTDTKWTEPHQVKILDGALRHLISDPRVTGTLVWQYADNRAALERGMALQRPRGFNNKGILNEHRVPKQAFYTVEGHYTALPRDGVAKKRTLAD